MPEHYNVRVRVRTAKFYYWRVRKPLKSPRRQTDGFFILLLVALLTQVYCDYPNAWTTRTDLSDKRFFVKTKKKSNDRLKNTCRRDVCPSRRDVTGVWASGSRRKKIKSNSSTTSCSPVQEVGHVPSRSSRRRHLRTTEREKPPEPQRVFAATFSNPRAGFFFHGSTS